MNFHIAVIPGDGIGPEIVTQAKKVLDKVGEVYGHTFEYEELLMRHWSAQRKAIPYCSEPSEEMSDRATGTSCHRTRDRKQVC